MSLNDDQGDGDDGQLRQFEKNTFFQGKLMTARDMETEQDYHAGRLQTLSRFVTGTGIVRGIEVSSVEESETELEVTLEPGLVLDGYGRPIVIEHRTTKTLPLPSSDDMYLFIRYAETELESVPVPDVSGASSEEYMSNRRVESFELTYQESPPDRFDAIPTVDTDVGDNPDEDTAFRALANRYHQQFRTPVEQVEDPSIFIGSFERTDDGTWIPGGDTVRRDLAYDNEMLYAALVNHIADTDDPHGTGGRGGAAAGDLGDVAGTIEELSDQIDTLTRYVMRKSLKDKIRFFGDVSTRFEEAESDASKTAQEIVEAAKSGMADDVFDDPEAYRVHVGDMLELDISLGEELEESATEESLERYVKAVNELQEVLAGDRGVLKVAEAQDGVCEAADSLEMLYDIVPEN